MGFEPDYQVIVEWEAVGEIVDAMGGVWFDVPRNMNYDDPLQNLYIHQENGLSPAHGGRRHAGPPLPP
ncbi:LCP family glycopolymer transferase [Dysosmobacter welbionis]|uniref:LCP family glycopolymer transferase n=1 Tax=Dysosmobacter welbionis TaxID=2093857 RepID=UPI00300E7BE9